MSDEVDQVDVDQSSALVIADEQKEELREFLANEIKLVRDDEERAELVTHWNEWRRQREAKPAQRTKNTPWPGASNVVVPLTLSNTNGMYAKIKSFVKARSPKVSGESPTRKHRLHAEVAAEVLNFFNNSPFHVNMPGKESTMLYDWVSMGSQVMEWQWQKKTVRVMRNGAFVEKVIKEGPELVLHPLEDVLVRLSGREEIQDMPWIGFLYRFYGHELKSHAATGFFDPDEVESLLPSAVTEATSDNNQLMDERSGISPKYESDHENSGLYDVVKAFVWFDGDNDGQLEDLIVWIEPESRAILRIDYNPVGFRLITNGKYLPMPHKFYGVGLGKISHDMQEEVDTFHNLRINTQRLSSSTGIIRRRGTETFNKGKVIEPGFEFMADDPRNDYVQWMFPDVTMSTLNGENQARGYLETAIGAHDSFFGRPDQVAKSGTSFSLQNLQASRGDSIFDSIAESIVEGYNDLFQKELMLLLTYSEEVRGLLDDFYDPNVDGAKFEALQELLSWEPEDIPSRVKFSVMTTDLAKTDEAKRQSAMMKFQVYSMIFDKMTQLIPALSQPEMDQETRRLILNGIVGYHDMLRQTLELMGETNIDEALMDVENYRVMAQIMDQMGREQAEELRRAYGQARDMEQSGVEPGGMDQAGPETAPAMGQDPGAMGPASPGGAFGGSVGGPGGLG